MSKEPRMSVDEFLAGDFLRRADVVLCANNKGGFSALIRFGTRSPFSHAAAVFVVPRRDLGFHNTFLIESAGKGVDITDLRHYLVDLRGVYKLAIKRLESDWFQAGVHEQVRGQMLDFIKAEYDYLTVWRLAKQIARRMLFGWNLVRRKSVKGLIAHDRAPNRFICSGFVQYAYYAAVCRMLAGQEPEAARSESAAAAARGPREDDRTAQRRLLEAARQARLGAARTEAAAHSRRTALAERIAAADLARLEEVDFAGGGEDADPLTALLATTPEDMAVTDKLAWKYAIADGQVWEVSSYAEARDVMGLG